MVRFSGLDVTEGQDESYHSTKADYRQASLAAVQLPSFNPRQICDEEGDPHSLRSTAWPLHCELVMMIAAMGRFTASVPPDCWCRPESASFNRWLGAGTTRSSIARQDYPWNTRATSCPCCPAVPCSTSYCRPEGSRFSSSRKRSARVAVDLDSRLQLVPRGTRVRTRAGVDQNPNATRLQRSHPCVRPRRCPNRPSRLHW